MGMVFHFKAFLIVIFILLFSVKSHSQVVLNELFITNGSNDLHVDYNYSDWIEIYNSTEANINCNEFFLSNDSTNLKKWQMPNNTLSAKEYKFFVLNDINGSTTHANFKVDQDHGAIYLSNKNGIIIDRFYYGKQYYNISFGRFPNVTGAFQYLLTPTRGTENSSPYADSKLQNVYFNKNGGYYDTPISLILKQTIGSGTIYYTLDGTEPNSLSSKYTVPISISKNTIVRAIIIDKTSIPGSITTHTYFINERKPNLPVMSVVSDPKNFFDPQLGIYVIGTNGISGNCANGRPNWNRDWERSANFELFNISKTQVVNQMLGVKIAGACSRTHPQKSLSLHAREKYGKGRLNYAFFKDRSFDNFNSILLRNGGNDFSYSICRDMVFQKLTDRFMNIDHQAGEPAVIYMNGQYYGIQFIYERSGEDLVEASYGLDQENIDLGEGPGSALQGNTKDYQNLLTFINSNHLGVKSNYEKVATQIDIDNYIEYLILQMYIGNSDWPGNNTKFWRMNNPKGKWRWILFDTDFGFEIYNEERFNYNMFALMQDSLSSNWPNYEWSTRLYRKLIQNPEFKKNFVNRFYAHINSTFKPENVVETIDSIANLIRGEAPYHYEKWGGSADNWEYNIQLLKDYSYSRPDTVRQQLRDFMGAGEDVELRFNSAGSPHGLISIDQVQSTDTAYSGIFPKGSALKIKFISPAGYTFKKASRSAFDAGTNKFVTLADAWSYFDQDPSIVAANWSSLDFDDSSWKTGNSQFGYGESDENTIISYGSNANNKYITSYYRKKITYDTTKQYSNHTLRLLVDDGAVIYLNGIEVIRKNLPQGNITHTTLATNAEENIFNIFIIPDTCFKHGENILAVEVHQSSVTSSDLSFELELTAPYFNSSIQTAEISKSEFTDTIIANVHYKAWFEPIVPIADLILNEISPNNRVFTDEYGEKDDWIEVYNYSHDSIDLSGLYITDSLADPLKFRIPEYKTKPLKIAPGEYKILWADKQWKQGPFHVNFKLDSDGEEIGIFQKVGENVMCLDSISFSTKYAHQAVGRIPNITGNFKNLYHATLANENVDLPYTEISEVNKENDFVKILFYRNQKLLDLEFRNQKGMARVQIVDISGRIMSYKQTSGSQIQLSMQSLKPGIYLIVAEKSGMKHIQKLVVY